jgi:hypothetical protein
MVAQRFSAGSNRAQRLHSAEGAFIGGFPIPAFNQYCALHNEVEIPQSGRVLGRES